MSARLLPRGHAAVPTVQAKLSITVASDPLERRADQIADDVMRMPESKVSPSSNARTQPSRSGSLIPPSLQRCAGHCSNDWSIDRKAVDGNMSRRPSPISPTGTAPIEGLHGGGQPLHENLRGFFEPRLGVDLSAVRVHVDAATEEVARGISARAFTVGTDIGLRRAEYQPDSQQGRRLLAHELAHVLQQTGADGHHVAIQRQEVQLATRYLRDLRHQQDDPTLDAAIRETEEYRSYMREDSVWQRQDAVTAAEALLACKLVLADVRAGMHVDWPLQARAYLEQAREQLLRGPTKESDAKPTASSKLSGTGLDPELERRGSAMLSYLEQRGISAVVNATVRSADKAHFFSTGYHIYYELIDLDALRQLPDGKDQDGNLWYKPEWESRLDFFTWREATAHAFNQVKAADPGVVTKRFKGMRTGLTCAYEGYPTGDARRLPNTDAVPVSSHVGGYAVDIDINWDHPGLGGAWSATADAMVDSFGLVRPFRPDSDTYCQEEPWHFELKPGPWDPPPIHDPMKMEPTE